MPFTKRNVGATQASPHRAATHSGKTILIADDSAMMRTIIRQAIERDTDFVVCSEAVDGTDAVAKAKELSPDLVILDLRMPGLNGVQAAGILRHALPRTRIVLLTLYVEDIEPNFVSLFRIDAVLAKTDGLTDLGAQVTRLMTDRTEEIATPPEALGAV